MRAIDKITDCISKKQVFFSFEFFPPKTAAGVQNLYKRIDRLGQLGPLFCDVTWGAGGSNHGSTIEISSNAQKMGMDILMHLTCVNLTPENAITALDAARNAGIQNILVLRGDPVQGASSFEECDKGFSHAIDLIRFIRKKYKDAFCIGVAAHPEGHLHAADKQQELVYLKEKVDAGAGFIITQLFYDVFVYKEFVCECRQIGITCPIIPGVMPIQTYGGFVRMTSFCEARVPGEIQDALEPIKGNDEAVKEYGIRLGVKMCRKLLEDGAPGLHFYTLNLERAVRAILSELNLVNVNSIRELPWHSTCCIKRAGESIRPIYWSNRPESYVARTALWDEYPNGRWGNSESPAFGELSDSPYVTTKLSASERREMWGHALKSTNDITKTFVSYVRGDIKSLPWCNTPLHLETKSIREQLISINKSGYWTLNSQPKVNGAPSEDPVFGWGGDYGHVYQKAYIECFTSPQQLRKLMDRASAMNSIQYYAIDSKGNSYSSAGNSVIAVTWGVFRDKEILQPTIMDRASFIAWKDEAFALWISMWGILYEKDSESQRLIREIHDSYFLVSIVENDFVHGDIWALFHDEIKELENGN
uniref:Methylenetetrahydrofolate reductase putative n=1 Tax=Albugo laibachii Nc14 TaxID=890382 RepID=F0W2Q3_9STRA|nr:methylenetetrahydrofolate reductase putative [Albugo laibachii Nc14]|eukprot:CCA15339.1 methylenetetrahydrofolate reductase putative [Albugo laibachii Nc14]